MESRNWEDWALGLTFVGAAALAMTLHEVRAPSFLTAAIAGERTVPAYVMTVTAQRLPAECKGIVGRALPANCAAIIDGATVSVREYR
jgi:hypothetical protein